ncbi:MAG: S1C family serine protease [Candidatus Bipolaricaulia bacterium]
MHIQRSRFVQVLALAVVALTLAGCPGPTPPPTRLEVGALDDVKRATIQIEAQGSFIDPDVGLQQNVAGRGSGFIIDESGIAVTNNHVVTGAAFLRVWVGGESEPRNARILGVSECSDLAVIDIEGDGYSYLGWYDDRIYTGLDVYAAGFPLGDPEFTLTRGIVSKERAGGETSWASVDAVIEHDATINPGNSGGPLVTQDGKVVGINYAGLDIARQSFAIARDEALKIIDQLRAGQDMTSIGVNGTAMSVDGYSGIWVSSVKPGSPADASGVKGGDLITQLQGVSLATDDTMADYCDILRSHSPGDTLTIEVVRFDTQEVLAGQINGRQLESVGSPREPGPELELVYNYHSVTNDSGALVMDIPQEWDDVNGSPWTKEDEVIGAAISASSNLGDFYDTYATPGVFFGASRVLIQSYDEAGFLDTLPDFSEDCTYEGRFDYEDPLYTGLYNLYTNCGGIGSQLVDIVAVPDDRAFLIWVEIQTVTEPDLDALQRILDTFEVVGDLPS